MVVNVNINLGDVGPWLLALVSKIWRGLKEKWFNFRNEPKPSGHNPLADDFVGMVRMEDPFDIAPADYAPRTPFVDYPVKKPPKADFMDRSWTPTTDSASLLPDPLDRVFTEE